MNKHTSGQQLVEKDARLEAAVKNLRTENTRLRDEVGRGRTENARLQARVEEAERELAEHGCRKVEREAFRARDHYKALAARRKERLGVASHEVHWLREHEGTLKECAFPVCVTNLAAIEEEDR